MATTAKKSKKPAEKPVRKSTQVTKKEEQNPDDKTRMERIAEAYGD